MNGARRFPLAAAFITLLVGLCPLSSFAADEAIVSRIEAMDAGFPVQVLEIGRAHV